MLLQISKKPLKYNPNNKKNIYYLNYTYQEDCKKGAIFTCKFYSEIHGSIAGTQKFHENCETCYFKRI